MDNTPNYQDLPTSKSIAKKVTEDICSQLPSWFSPDQQRALVENSSYLACKWLTVAPSSKPLTIADSDIAAGLRTRLLRLPKTYHSTCPGCAGPTEYAHHDTCKAANKQWINRHNRVAQIIAEAFAGDRSVKVTFEPTTGNEGSKTRVDLKIVTASAVQMYDVKIAAVHKRTGDPDPHVTLTRNAKQKLEKHKHLGARFHPLVFSAGGLMEKSTAQEFKKLQKLMGTNSARWATTLLSVELLRYRSLSFYSVEHQKFAS